MENSAVLGFEADVARVRGDGDDRAGKTDTKEVFQVFLDFDEVVLVHLQQGVVKSVAKVSLAAIGEGDQIGEGLDVFLVVGAGNEGDKGAQKIGDGDDLITLVATDDAGFAARVHAGGNAGEVFEAGIEKGGDDNGCAGAAAKGNNFGHLG